MKKYKEHYYRVYDIIKKNGFINWCLNKYKIYSTPFYKHNPGDLVEIRYISPRLLVRLTIKSYAFLKCHPNEIIALCALVVAIIALLK